MAADIDIVTLAQGKAQLRIEQSRTDLDAEIELKITGASQIVLTHIKRDDLSEWADEESPANYLVPFDIVAATLIALTYLFDQREAKETLPAAFFDLLTPYRDPTFA